ncbi:hypothetical protein [Streptomyces bauhiniae]|uniref:hypothetical protein n=1 Tax=Streptomyces bauhiniae TaxID=2340725 RepID=UPI0035DB1714
MPADEVTRGAAANTSRVRGGPRHAAPKKLLFTRFHMPTGKAIATVAMPTAVLVGLGFTSSLALASNGSPSPSNTQQAEDYRECVKALGDDKDPSASPSPSASESASESASPSPSADDKDTQGGTDEQDKGSPGAKDTGDPSSSDSGSDDKGAPDPSATSETSGSGSDSAGDATKPAPEETGSKARGILGTIGDTIGDILTGGHKDSGAPSDTPTPSASQSSSPASAASTSPAAGGKTAAPAEDAANKAPDTVEDKARTATDTVAGKAKGAVEDAGKKAEDATGTAGDKSESPTPDPSASESALAKDCVAATEDEGGVDNKVLVADDPWYLDASSLYLKQADYQGVVEVQTASGKKKKVLKYVISGGTDIGDLHQIVRDKQTNKTYHVQSAKGMDSHITGGDTVMYTESISGNLFGLLPVTFSPDSPPPLNIPYIYFTHVKVTQAAQFGGNLTIPGMRQYTTD